jgi:hypothetical protein
MAVGAPLSADWLVMNDGTRVETDGPWNERGKLVVFTDTSGNLVSLRLSEVDLVASRQATADALEAASRPAPPPAPRESVFRLTDADVGHVDPDDEAAATGEVGAEGEGEAGDSGEPEPAPMAVQVIGWDRTETFDGVAVRATLENQGDDVAIGIEVSVTIYDQEGVALSTAPAQIVSTGLVAGQTTDMEAEFPGFHDFSAVNFDIRHRSIATRATEDVPSSEDGGLEGEAD